MSRPFLPRLDRGASAIPAVGRRAPFAAFTLVELLVAMVVGTLLIVFLFQLFDASTKAWRQGEDQADTYREARAALQLITRDLSQTIGPMNASAYAAPTPAPGATPRVIAPSLVVDRYPNPQPPAQSGDEINEEVYCLATLPNNGASSLCAVGYFCVWKPDISPASTVPAPRAFSLMRQFLGSGAPANSTTSPATAAIPGLYDRLSNSANSMPLSFLNVFERATPPSISTATPPQSTATELASFIWDFQVRIPSNLQGAPVNTAYPATPTYSSTAGTSWANSLPPYVEVRFKALSETAARRLSGNTSITRADWSDSSTSAVYKNVILPGTRQFSARVPLYSGAYNGIPTSTPAP